MKRNFYLLLFFLTFLPFTSCSTDDINLDGEDIYDLDAYFAEWVKETYGQDLEWAYEYLNGTPNVFRNEDRSIFTMGQFKVVDKEGNNLIDQIDTDKVRIYQVINDKEILQEKEFAYNDQVWDTKDVNEDFFSRMTEEQIIDYWKKHNIRYYKSYGVQRLDSIFLLSFYRKIMTKSAKYIIRWNDQWSDEVEGVFLCRVVKWGGKLGYQPLGLLRVWANGELIYDKETLNYVDKETQIVNTPVITFIH
ncbi:MAG: hypothetical protein IJ726_01630 [Phocaeicola sp.]|jgi:hypothetical protein|nr:hypothetical protein [Phocaeicola sp.]MBR1719105.1 hypothetical protein [Phocaeicola sp.]